MIKCCTFYGYRDENVYFIKLSQLIATLNFTLYLLLVLTIIITVNYA